MIRYVFVFKGLYLVSVVYIYPLHFLLFDKWLPLHRAQIGSVFFGLLQSLEGAKDLKNKKYCSLKLAKVQKYRIQKNQKQTL